MADFDFRKESVDERVLVISFDNGKPMSAAQLAGIFKALDADYKQMTGRDLVVARLELGSTWIWLVDIATGAGGWIKGTAGVAKAAQDLGTFARKLRDGFKSSKASVPLSQTDADHDSVDRSITAMAQASEKTGSTIFLRKTTITATGTETIDIEVTPAQAKEARKRAKNRPKRAQTVSPPTLKAIAHHEELVRRMRALPQASRDLEVGIRVMVQATVVNGGRYLLEQVAGTLDGEGRRDIATIIRQELEGGQTFVQVDN